MSKAVRYLAVFRAKGTKPDPHMENGWLSISLTAGSAAQAKDWALHRAEMLAPWLIREIELVHLEPYKPSPEMAGPYRGLVVTMD